MSVGFADTRLRFPDPVLSTMSEGGGMLAEAEVTSDIESLRLIAGDMDGREPVLVVRCNVSAGANWGAGVGAAEERDEPFPSLEADVEEEGARERCELARWESRRSW